ncbi:hypothetical protein ACG873_08735 [Mesorhizobium sp. AaZ16]|uniref:hypothetical protein n=1 Tax=Mesorhizobium sp. AaZ16 TaxID=3402289 RepID=UPI00374FD3F1
MILDRLIALYYWKSAKSLSKNDMAAAARRFLAAYDRQPTNERYATRALEVAAEAGLYPAAHRICCEQAARGDDLGYWTRYDSYITELEDAPAAPAVGSDLVALFNDTDRRPNIGCRLTSQSLKSVIARTLPQATIVSSGFRFSVFRSKPSPTEPNSRATIEKTLEAMVRTGYGADAVQQVRRSALVVLQPEGALDDDVDLRGLVIFFPQSCLRLCSERARRSSTELFLPMMPSEERSSAISSR